MIRYRCSEGRLGCGRRFTKRLAPHQYARAVRCPHCKSIHNHSVEKAAVAQKHRRRKLGLICFCRNYPFPHVRGTLRMCELHPRIMRSPTHAEWKRYQSLLAMPRGT